MSSKEVLFEVGTSITTDPTFRVVRSETGEIETHYDCTYPTREPGSVGVTATRDASGNVTVLKSGDKRVGNVNLLNYQNEGGFTALPSSAEQIVGSVVLIPANTLKPGDKFRFVYASEDAGTADAQIRVVRVRIHTTSSVLSGNVLVNGVASTASNTKCLIDKTALVVSNTKSKYIAGLASASISATAFSDTTIDCTVDQYIGLTIQNANTLVNHLLYYANLSLEVVQ